ncbi:hypothetical protein MaudMau93_001986 [Microsporum audouinii]
MALDKVSLPRRSDRILKNLKSTEDSDDDYDNDDAEQEAQRLLQQFLYRKESPSRRRAPSTTSLKRKADCLTDSQHYYLPESKIPLSITGDNTGNQGRKDGSQETSNAITKDLSSKDNENSENQPPDLIEQDGLPSPSHSWAGDTGNTPDVFSTGLDGSGRTRAALPEATHNSNNNTLDSESSCVDTPRSPTSQCTSCTLPTSVPFSSCSSSFGNTQTTSTDIPLRRPPGRPPRSPNLLKMGNHAIPTRRSKREKVQPINYYAPIPGFTDCDEDYEMEAPEQITIDQQPPPQLPSFATKRVGTVKPRLIYQSHAFHILQEPLNSNRLNDNNTETGLPYASSETRRKSEELISRKAMEEGSTLFHVDFTLSEMTSLYTLLCGHSIPDDETPVQDHLSNAIQFVDIEWVVKKIRKLRKLNSSLPPGFDINSILNPELSQLKMSKRLQRVVRRIARVCGKSVVDNRPEGYINMIEGIGRTAITTVLQECETIRELEHRNLKVIPKFLLDAQARVLSSTPSSLVTYRSSAPSPRVPLAYTDVNLPSALLRSRQIGHMRHGGKNRAIASLRELRSRKWELWKTWKGASHDVMVLSWAPDGTKFVAGTTTHCEDNMQYNRNNNLLLGDLVMGSIRELPDHRVPRPLIATGDFANQNTFNSLDPDLYMTISAVQWSESYLYTASYDKTVKVWETQPQVRCVQTLLHPEKLDVMAISGAVDHLVATGCQDTSPVRIWSATSNNAHSCVELNKYPGYVSSSLTWGSNSSCADMLAAGLSRKFTRSTFSSSKYGWIVLWQVEASYVNRLMEWEMSQHISDIKWHSTKPLFIAGCSTPTKLVRSTRTDVRSVVHLYDPLRSKHEVGSFNCSALDINEVTFCPVDDNYITASCTDNLTYAWDRRNPSSVLHKLGHGKPISQLDTSVPQEEDDTGVCLAIWSGASFYTGGSDGIIKSWDVRRSADDLIVEDIASFSHGIMSGALSPDQTNILAGDSGGSIHVLSTAPFSRENGQDLTYEAAVIDTQDDAEEKVSGILEAKKLIESGQLSRHPKFGVGKGVCYEGPFASWARPPETHPNDMSITPLHPTIQEQQLDGPPVHQRLLLSNEDQQRISKHISLATARNQRGTEIQPPRGLRRTQQPLTPTTGYQSPQSSSREVIEISSDESDVRCRRRTRKIPFRSCRKVTLATPSRPRTRSFKIKSEPVLPDKSVCIDLTGDGSDDGILSPSSLSSHATCISKEQQDTAMDDNLEEDGWWPHSRDILALDY